ncbi:MAG TPA: benzoyl-CoA 2,3-epoxidase subunit BoxB [Myxococcota bacterium]|nr:benzoyl-CoA 2,3-epoxidase subunit BoxB [Myxococcota bacterium]
MSIDLSARIPNNVDLASDPKLRRALESWQPAFLRWWDERGPDGLQRDEIYLRTAVGVDREGWAHYDYVRMPDYRWGIFLAPAEAERAIAFGDPAGKPAWQQVPGEHRAALRRLIVTQGDTEPASVEQQRRLGARAPSLYDLRNLLQVNVEEARHLWAMVYLLFSHFGRDGREEAEALLARESGEPDHPRILGAFNRPISTWLDFFCFATFTDRDGKYQLASLAESGFDPLARTCRFMLTEEAHHLSVGEGGVRRIVARTAELMKRDPNEDARAQGGIDLPLLQRFINHWYSESLDLFGSPDSSNAATYFATGLKGRYQESKAGVYDDHALLEGSYGVERPAASGGVEVGLVPARRAINAALQDSYTRECEKSLGHWNQALASAGIAQRLALPSARFNRKIGPFAESHWLPDGRRAADASAVTEQLPNADDLAWLAALQDGPVLERGQCASWLAAPSHKIDGQPLDFEYVRFA